jgi:hypothetical protein
MIFHGADFIRRRASALVWKRQFDSEEGTLMNARNPDVGISKVTKSNATPWRIAALSVAVLGCGHVAAAQEAQKMFIEGDIVRGNTPNGNTGPVCVLANQFKRKENVIFRIRVRNITGQPLDDKNIRSIVVELSDGKKYPAEYRARPPVAVRAALGLTGPIDYFWSAAWLIPQDYPTGSLRYRVVATDVQGNTQDWTPFNDLRSLPVVMPGDVEYTR